MRTAVPTKSLLEKKYNQENLSAAQIAACYGWSANKVNYWLAKFNIEKRGISDAVYARLNPHGDPFTIKTPRTLEESFLLGVGLGLYWGEGTKSNKTSVRLGNTDPDLIKVFLRFLIEECGVRCDRLSFGLQIFSDMDPAEAKSFWMKKLNVAADQFQKIIVTPARSLGTYRQKTRHGVLTIYFNNRKLRDHLVGAIENMRSV